MKNQKLVWMIMPPPDSEKQNEMCFVKKKFPIGPLTSLETRGPRLLVNENMNEEPHIRGRKSNKSTARQSKKELKLPEINMIDPLPPLQRE